MIPLTDLRAQYHRLKAEIDQAIHRVLERGQFILGPEVEALEREVASYCGAKEAVAVGSGTDALELTLRACGIGPGDEVLTTAWSFFATPEAVLAVGATPVFVDIEPTTFTIDPAQLESKLSSRTKAVLPVHLYGHPCDMEALVRIATRHGLALIEDCAQAMGARYRDRSVGTFGVAGCVSFFPSKNLGAYGDGGMVVTNDAALAEKIRRLRVHGSRQRYLHETLGTNSRLDELQAAILRVKLSHLDAWNEARRLHAQTYGRLMAEQGLAGVALPVERPGCHHVYCLFVVRCRARDVVFASLSRAGIDVQITYPLALPHQPALAFLGHHQGQFMAAERAATEVLSLPMYPELTPHLIERIVQATARALSTTPLPV